MITHRPPFFYGFHTQLCRPHIHTHWTYTHFMNQNTQQSWTLTGANDQLIYGNTHLPADQPHAIVLMAHGLKSYKDYGFQPALGAFLASHGYIVHRFNFSHSGMTNDIDTFAKPALFEKDTWNKQVTDLKAVAQAVRLGALPGAIAGNELPQIWLGHSRGGNTTLLAAGRAFEQGWQVQPAGVITLAAGDTCCRLTSEQRKLMHDEHGYEMLSSRTGQVLRQGEAWLSEQEADPDAHDPLKAIQAIRCPVLLLHGQLDETVPHDDSLRLKQAADQVTGSRVTFVSMADTNHTFNAPNPLAVDSPVPAQTKAMFEHVAAFVKSLV